MKLSHAPLQCPRKRTCENLVYLERAILVSWVLVMSDGSMQLQSEWRYVIVAIFTFIFGVCVESTRKRVTKFHYKRGDKVI